MHAQPQRAGNMLSTDKLTSGWSLTLILITRL